MSEHNRTATQAKILAGMDTVYEKLIESKKKINSDFIIMKDDKIVRVKPEDMETLAQVKERREERLGK